MEEELKMDEFSNEHRIILDSNEESSPTLRITAILEAKCNSIKQL